MGPRFFKRGDAVPFSGTTARSSASMGPRFFKRGDQHRNAVPADRRKASMGPRFFKRGDKPGDTVLVTEGVLQWGHASLSVETSGFEIGRSRRQCFNGATLL